MKGSLVVLLRGEAPYASDLLVLYCRVPDSTDLVVLTKGVWRRWSPRIPLSIDNSQSWVVNVIASELVDLLDIRWVGDIECLTTDSAEILEIEGPRDQ